MKLCHNMELTNNIKDMSWIFYILFQVIDISAVRYRSSDW